MRLSARQGRYDLRLPQIRCKACEATWSPGVDDLIHNDYSPATSHHSTVYATDVLFSFEELKMAAPGMSSQAFLRILDQRTVRFGRVILKISTSTPLATDFDIISPISFPYPEVFPWINGPNIPQIHQCIVGNITADKSFLEWEAVRFEVDKLCQEDHFDCPACSPDMLAVSVDGNRKHYRFKSAARSEEQAIFDGVFIANDDDVARFVDYVHTSTSHVSGRGVCGGQWSAARKTSQKSSGKTDEEGLELAVCRHGVLLRALNMFRGEIFAYLLYLQKQMACKQVTFFTMDVACKYWPYLRRVTEKCPELQDLLTMRPFLSVFHAKAHDFKCEVKWSGAYQEGAGSTLGEEVEQCNAFLSRIAVTTKHMSKAGRIDMLTVMAMRWNQRKFDNLASALARRYRKATIALQCQLHNMEAMKMEMDITDNQLESWIIDINEWAEATTSPNDADLAAVASRIEELVANVKRRSQRLYKDNDGCKGRARIRRKIREGKKCLLSVVEKYNTLVPNAEHLTLDTILSDEIVWPWQLTHGDSVDLRTKRKAFDMVMAVRRLEEEKRILIAEMNKHWKSLCTRADTLKHMSSRLSNVTSGETWGLLQDGIQGLQSLTMKNKQASNSLAKHAKNCYVQVLTETEINFDSDSEEYHTSSDSEHD
ncbi:uncharacterized protein LOC131531206 isoform X1 [Onychostoma macrolepis]|uniref:uncharacterized protein LOC131531206 isoform X1 n=1 Tax=Onychostoma macrolepis TaxID=369639 RepID=UPI00272970DB|nr:uncharacterized protein LOC131531206 isoform X1 [Onychostoma macrolepis]XP_058617797.1 uncharacterized protein LOC131531206 isoform X1 [Onychostoma macrolepis]XP_058617798.1 uncharacterized protein LOC131531206 isoform X1 [Onychostoma macrolepis]XP_058617799.1 uncharacterized protein LOC131531206 isoform X1 [Onychostoma macrolepis]